MCLFNVSGKFANAASITTRLKKEGKVRSDIFCVSRVICACFEFIALS
jgi:hypothetical protein